MIISKFEVSRGTYEQFESIRVSEVTDHNGKPLLKIEIATGNSDYYCFRPHELVDRLKALKKLDELGAVMKNLIPQK